VDNINGLSFYLFFLGLIMSTEGLSSSMIIYPSQSSPPYQLNFLEHLLEFVILFSVLLAIQMLIDIPGVDLPDIKDIRWLFPNLNDSSTLVSPLDLCWCIVTNFGSGTV
jgi:hypothetical protein